jgi:hypothetical protein
MIHNVTKLPQVKDNKSHVKHILLYRCQICLTTFLQWCAKYASSEANRGQRWGIFYTTCVKCDFVPVPDLQFSPGLALLQTCTDMLRGMEMGF